MKHTSSDTLARTEERDSLLPEFIPVQVWMAFPDGKLEYVSEQTARAFGLSSERLLADGWQEVVHPEDLMPALDRWRTALESGSNYQVEFRLKEAAGSYVWYLSRAVPQRDLTGKILRWFGTNTNIEGERARQRQIEEMARQLREQNLLLAFEAEIGAVLARSDCLVDALEGCVNAMVQRLSVAVARAWTLNEAGTHLDLRASAGLRTSLDGPNRRVGVGDSRVGQIASERTSQVTHAVVEYANAGEQDWAAPAGIVSTTGYPLVCAEQLRGVLTAFSRHRFSAARLAALESAANAMAQAIERFQARDKLRQSEMWLSTTLNSVGEGVIATDAAGRVTFMNAVAATFTGVNAEKAGGRPLSEVFVIVNATTRAPVESPVDKVLRQGTMVGMANHTMLLRPDGTELSIEHSGAPILDSAGALSGVVLVFRDASEKRKSDAERAILLANEQRAHGEAEAARANLHRLFMQAPTPICILQGPEHTFTLANPGYMSLIGPERQLIGLPVRAALPELERQGFIELLDRVYAHGERHVDQEVPIRVGTANGCLRTAFLTFVYEALRDSDGRITGIVVIAFDVSEAFRARRELQAMYEERGRFLAMTEAARAKADFANRAKDEFLATASHELRTPLNAILGWARLLKNGTLDPSGFLRGIETIERNAKAQVQLIEDILDGSRIITGKLHLQVRSADLLVIVQAALDTVRLALSAKSISLSVVLDPLATHVQGDADRLQQVVWNLVNNALKFTAKGGHVEVRVERVGTSIELTVKDDGEGIAEEFLPHVFERFRQADASTTRQHGGLGLGLALVRHLVEAHGGSVRAESPGPGLGATFTATFPVQAVFPTEVPSLPPSRPGALTLEPLHDNGLAGKSVLVVDDEADARDLVGTLLRVQGAEVRLAACVDEALWMIAERNPEVLISDIGMPLADGYSLIGRVRALTGPAGLTPAIALTAYARDEDRNRVLAAGFDAYLSKPVDPDTLVRLVSTLEPRACA